MYLILIINYISLEYWLMGLNQLRDDHIQNLALIYSVNYDFRNRYIKSLSHIFHYGAF